MRKLFTLSLGVFIGISAFSQENKEVELNWKINPGEIVTYQTIMNEIDTSTIEYNFGNLFEVFMDSTEDVMDEAKNLLKELNESFKNINLLTELTNNGDGTVEIVMKTRPEQEVEEIESDTTDIVMDAVMKMILSMKKGIMLRGSVYETGGIHSFWVKSNQKNLIAMFFELPSKPVKIGDYWPLEINFIANDQNFKCDSAYQVNKVTLTDLKSSNGETIAVIKYEIEEFVDGSFDAPALFGSGGATETTMKFTYHAIAEFSVDKGRWVSYDGIMGMVTSGIMTANTKKKFSLLVE
ncbi:MAG: hypothetical protein JKY54_10425 [Flavobacteriales bacterium]|nr:hypothetical protein [Flavobacteriales bacterium]